VLRNTLKEDFSNEEVDVACGLLRTVIGTIVVLFSSLSVPTLADLLGLPAGDVLEALRDLHSILDVPDDPSSPIRPHHTSVHDFLLDCRRCTDEHFVIDERWAHTHVAT
jgi:hypothetical protein